MPKQKQPKDEIHPEPASDYKTTLSIKKWLLIPVIICLGILAQDYFISPKFALKVRHIDEKDLLEQNITFETHCRPENYKSHLVHYSESAQSVCICKPYPYWNAGCASKLEFFSKKPFVLKVHGAFESRADEISKYADRITMRPVMFGGELGNSWVSPYINSEDGVLKGDMPVVQSIYRDLARLTGMVYPCGEPGAAVVRYRYKKGEFFNVHHDGFSLTLEPHFGLTKTMHYYRRFVGVLEMCRHRYATYNVWQCVYKLFTGSLQWTDYWNTHVFGPQIFSAMAQLSEVDGGETFFPQLGIVVHTNPGDLFLWANVDDNWKRYDNSAHGACPVVSEHKLVLVVFVPGMCNKLEDIKRVIFQSR